MWEICFICCSERGGVSRTTPAGLPPCEWWVNALSLWMLTFIGVHLI